MLGTVDALASKAEFDSVFMISATNGDGVTDLEEWLARTVPVGPWLYPPDQVADLPVRMMAAEITRGKLMLRVHQELPYNATVETESWKRLKDGSLRVEQIVYVNREAIRG